MKNISQPIVQWRAQERHYRSEEAWQLPRQAHWGGDVRRQKPPLFHFRVLGGLCWQRNPLSVTVMIIPIWAWRRQVQLEQSFLSWLCL